MVPDWAWLAISPRRSHGGLLCPSCICRRLDEKGIKCVGHFLSGPLTATQDDLPDNYDRAIAQRDAERARADEAEDLLRWIEAWGWICEPGCCADRCRCEEVRRIALGGSDE